MFNSSQSAYAILTSRMSLKTETEKPQGLQEEHSEIFMSLKVKTIEWYKRVLNELEEDQAIIQILPNYYMNKDEDTDEDTLVKKKQELTKE
jgi:hypothetical protein